jgi:sulfatase modifying factor 1
MKNYLVIVLIMLSGCMATKNGGHTTGRPKAGSAWDLPLPGNVVLPMVWIPPGRFDMGSPDNEPGRKADEGPVMHVTLTKGYWLGKTEVTIGQWKAVTGETMRAHVRGMLDDETVYDFGTQQKKLREFMNFNRDDPDRIMGNENDSMPMYFTSWNDAMSFCATLNKQEKANGHLPDGYQYSLPTEAQWEYACRAGTATATFNGPLIITGRASPVLDDIAWYGANNAVNYQGRKLGNTGAGPRNAGEKKPNAWGLQDMTGNLWEWCLDAYGPYPGGNVTDPPAGGPPAAIGRVNRGGSWGSAPASERSAGRASNPQPERSAWRGFRIALCAIP